MRWFPSKGTLNSSSVGTIPLNILWLQWHLNASSFHRQPFEYFAHIPYLSHAMPSSIDYKLKRSQHHIVNCCKRISFKMAHRPNRNDIVLSILEASNLCCGTECVFLFVHFAELFCAFFFSGCFFLHFFVCSVCCLAIAGPLLILSVTCLLIGFFVVVVRLAYIVHRSDTLVTMATK